MDVELFMECEEEELEPWQQVDDEVEEDVIGFDDSYGQPGGNNTISVLFFIPRWLLTELPKQSQSGVLRFADFYFFGITYNIKIFVSVQ